MRRGCKSCNISNKIMRRGELCMILINKEGEKYEKPISETPHFWRDGSSSNTFEKIKL